ncbi:MAG: DUF599 family protein [Cohaesibacter sp.]|nr:DUF599 family protein [Cohaesibacter sp.]MCV6602202.1 DUF599 family protein [Cohaesibacter sp.]
MNQLSNLDILALGWFILLWGGFSLMVDSSSLRKKTLSYHMNQHRLRWMQTMAERELRMVDTAIITGLQNGTAFFASTSLLAIGAGFALLNSTDLALQVSRDLNLPVEATRGLWEVKVLVLITLYIYAFFKFGWAYRLFNYTSILIGAFPAPETAGSPEMDEAIHQASEANSLAGRHFNRGLRTFFFSLGVFAWFIHPLLFIGTTTYITLVLTRRQFFSRSSKLASKLVAE